MSFTQNAQFPASLKPAPQQMTLRDNYLDFTGDAGGNFAQQYLPELYEAEVERYGNRTIGGFLRMVGAEMPMTSDQVVWSEQNRLHIAYRKCSVSDASAATGIAATVTLNLTEAGASEGAVRVGQTILMSDVATGLIVQKALVQAVRSSANTSDKKLLDIKI